MLEEVIETARGNIVIFFYACFVLPLGLSVVFSPKVLAAQEFRAHRLQHFDLQSAPHGSRSHVVSMEARSSRSKSLLRKCVVIPWKEATLPKIQLFISRAVGAILIIIPADLKSLSAEDHEAFLSFESTILSEQIPVPVFFTSNSPELIELIESLETNADVESAATATQALFASFAANGFQLVTGGAQSKALPDFKLFNIVGHLSSYEGLEHARTIMLVAHYDSFGAAPTLSHGADSNASGVSILLELCRIFSKLYQSSKTRPKYNVIFLLSGGGKFNYQGTRQWIEVQLEQQDNPVHNLDFALCLDSLGKDEGLYFHVSKPPKTGSPGASIMHEFEIAAGHAASAEDQRMDKEPSTPRVSMVHKKINLGEDYLGWEHERFSIKRLPGYTLSHFPSSKDLRRNSILDVREKMDSRVVTSNANIIAEALLRYMYNLSHIDYNSSLLQNGLEVKPSHIDSWLDALSSRPRSAQLFTDVKKDPLIQTILHTLDHWLHEVHLHPVVADKKDPEFMMYTGSLDTIYAYRVKPAIFDLLLAIMIACYLGVIYLLVANFFVVEEYVQRWIDQVKHKQL